MSDCLYYDIRYGIDISDHTKSLDNEKKKYIINDIELTDSLLDMLKVKHIVNVGYGTSYIVSDCGGLQFNAWGTKPDSMLNFIDHYNEVIDHIYIDKDRANIMKFCRHFNIVATPDIISNMVWRRR